MTFYYDDGLSCGNKRHSVVLSGKSNRTIEVWLDDVISGSISIVNENVCQDREN